MGAGQRWTALARDLESRAHETNAPGAACSQPTRPPSSPPLPSSPLHPPPPSPWRPLFSRFHLPSHPLTRSLVDFGLLAPRHHYAPHSFLSPRHGPRRCCRFGHRLLPARRPAASNSARKHSFFLGLLSKHILFGLGSHLLRLGPPSMALLRSFNPDALWYPRSRRRRFPDDYYQS